MNCKELKQRLVDPRAKSSPEFADHISQCSACRARWTEWQAVETLLDRTRPMFEAPDDTLARVYQKLEAASERTEFHPASQPSRMIQFALRYAVVAAVAVVGLLGGRFMASDMAARQQDYSAFESADYDSLMYVDSFAPKSDEGLVQVFYALATNENTGEQQ